jgi:uncharacterized repeat protein (TIGR04076 family)
MTKCKITVLKITFDKEIADAYSLDWLGPCPVFTQGQEFTLNDPWEMPPNFCSTAWGDIFKNVQTICLGGNFPSARQEGVNISCCVDGVRPVIFKLERIEDA